METEGLETEGLETEGLETRDQAWTEVILQLTFRQNRTGLNTQRPQKWSRNLETSSKVP